MPKLQYIRVVVLKLFSIIETNIMKCVYSNLKPSILKMDYGRNTLFRLRSSYFNPLKAKLNPICHLLALLRAHHIFHVSRVRVKTYIVFNMKC